MTNKTMRELRAEELESVSGGTGVGGIGGGIYDVAAGMYQILGDWFESPSSTQAGMPLCGGAAKVSPCLLP